MAAGTRKEYELMFQLKAALGPNFTSSFKDAMQTTKKLQGTLDDVRKVQSDVSAYKKQNTAIDENKKKLESLITEKEKLQREMRETENPSDKLRQNLNKTEKQIATMTGKIETQQGELEKLGDRLRGAGIDTGNLNGENEKLRQTYKRVAEEQEKLSKVMEAQEKNAEAIAKARTELMKTVGVAAALGAAIYAGPVRSAMEFQTAMAKVGTIADEGVMTLGEMKSEILDLSNAMGISANDIAEDVYNAISAGQDTADAVRFVEQSVKLAKGGFAETGQALDVLTTILNAYGMESEQATMVSDMLIQTQNKGKVTVAELSSVMGKIIPTAKANSVQLEQLGAGYAIMTSNGIAAAETTTYMNSMMNELGKTGSRTDKALRDTTGSSFKELMESGKSLAEVLEIVENVAEEGGLTLADMFGSAEAGKAALTLMANGVDEFNASVEDMIQSTGAAERAFDKMMDTDETKVEKAKNSLKNLSIVVGETFLPYAGEAAEKLSELVTRFAEFARNNPETIKNVVTLAAKLLALRAAAQAAHLGFLNIRKGVLAAQKVMRLFAAESAAATAATATGAARATTSISLLRGAFTLLMGPVGIAVGLIGAATAGIIAYQRAQHKARQDTLNFADGLSDAADRFQEVSDKAKTTRELIDEYRNLKEAVEDVTTPAEDVAAAKERIYEIENLLIEQNPDVLNKYDQENGRIEQNLDLLEKKTEQELELARIQMEQAQYDAEQKLPDAAKELAKLEKKTKELDEQYQLSAKMRNELSQIEREWDIFSAVDRDRDETSQKIEELTGRAQKFADDLGVEGWFRNMSDIMWANAEYRKEAEDTFEKMNTTREELKTVQQSFQEYYDTNLKLIELDLGSKFQTAVTELENMKKELAELTEQEEGGSEKAQKLQEKIAELEPKVEAAAVQIRDLGLSIEEVPEVKTIDVEEALKNVDGFIQKLDEIPPTKRVQLITEQVNRSIEEGKKEQPKGWFRNLMGLATGGIVKKPSIVAFAEEGPEAAIPLDGSDNAKRLWAHTGEILGMFNAARVDRAPALAPASAPAPELRIPSRNVEQSIVMHSNPVIHVNGGTATEDLERQLQRHDEQLLSMMEEWYRKKQDDERRQRYE